MRRLLSVPALLSLALPMIVALPVVGHRGATAHAVGPTVHQVPLVLGRSAITRSTPVFDTMGATWTGSPAAAIEVRTHTHGTWSPWTSLGGTDGGPDTGTVDARSAPTRTVSEPLWVGRSDGLQVRSQGAPVAGLKIVLVDGGKSPADADPAGLNPGAGSASAAAAAPTVYTRAQWGADESLRSTNSGCGTPEYSSTIKVGFVHHTDTANGYATGDVPTMLRSIYAYHVKSNGWCDIGYNFLVDRFGRVWEGRYGGTDRAVLGAHTGGFNKDSFGVSLLGTYSSVVPSSAMITGLQRLMAWKLGRNFADPTGKATLVSAGGASARWPAGTAHTFIVGSGHRDAGFTECPGNAAYAKLPAIRSAVRSLIGAGLVTPTLTPAGSTYRVRAGVLSAQLWRLTVTELATGRVVRTYTGSTSSSIDTTWDGKDDLGVPVTSVGLRFDLTSSNARASAVPWSVDVGLPKALPLSVANATGGPADVTRRNLDGTVSTALLDNATLSIWVARAGSIVGTPSLLARPDGSAVIAAQGKNGLLTTVRRTTTGAWLSWASLPGAVTSSPALAARGTGRSDLVVRAPDGQLQHRWTTSTGAWSAGEALGGKLAPGTAPGIAWTSTDRLDILVTGSDSHLWRKTWDRAHGWSAWQSLGGATHDAVALVASGPALTTGALRGTNGQLYLRTFGGPGPSSWSAPGKALVLGPGLAASPNGDLTVLLTGLDGLLAVNRRIAGTWTGFGSVTQTVTSPPPSPSPSPTATP